MSAEKGKKKSKQVPQRTVLRSPAFHAIPDRRPLQDVADVQHVRRVDDVVVEPVDVVERMHAAQRTEVELDAVDVDARAVKAHGRGQAGEER